MERIFTGGDTSIVLWRMTVKQEEERSVYKGKAGVYIGRIFKNSNGTDPL